MKCQECEGEGRLAEHYEPGYGTVYFDCWRCGGKGRYTVWNQLSFLFWTNAPVWFVEWECERRANREHNSK